MNDFNRLLFRTRLLAQLVAQRPKLGRTALMKLAYLLQTVRGVPLGYDFRLYTYGPFDSDLLNDLSRAESFGLVQSQMIPFSSGSGYGYEFSSGAKQTDAPARFAEELAKHEADMSWALENFANYSASDLELLTTIIYADREIAQHKGRVTPQDLSKMVRGVKPHFTDSYVAESIDFLRRQGLLQALN
jgi:uncharacterized protein